MKSASRRLRKNHAKNVELMPSVVKKTKQIPRHTDVFVLHMTMETLTKGVIQCLQHLQVQDPQHNLVVGG